MCSGVRAIIDSRRKLAEVQDGKISRQVFVQAVRDMNAAPFISTPSAISTITSIRLERGVNR